MKCESMYFVLVAVGIAACSMVYTQSPLPMQLGSGGGNPFTAIPLRLLRAYPPFRPFQACIFTRNGRDERTSSSR